MTAAVALAAVAAAVGAGPVVAQAPAVAFEPVPGLDVVDQVVTALAFEPDPAFAALLLEAAVLHLDGADPAVLAELLDAVLLSLPEDAARRLAPALVAQLAGRDADLLADLAAAAAPVLGVEAMDLGAAAHRLSAPVAAVPWAGGHRTGTTPTAVLRAEIPLSGIEPLPLDTLVPQAAADLDLTWWVERFLEVLPYLTQADLQGIATLWGLTPEDLLALQDWLAVQGIDLPAAPAPAPLPLPPPDPGLTASPW
ncbi:hypothetical protein [Caenispirillum bisanense]|uniref:Uncharacterized protein n=1 Tax=Caenispirillum bisanense TaxID=414052 RepID=A0A286GNU2_9PROT|nr:hypothetical protein [Caenispirillum bisanense]SOD97207.1 hypothetical protein SAMN05421508_106330 [Caenispirillum bisanense]